MAKLKAAKQKKEKPSASSRKAEDDGLRDSRRKRVSKAVQDKLEQDDAEIAALEKKLGLKKGKLPKSFAEDGLDELLGDLGGGSADEGRKRKREADEWLLNKRRKAQGVPVEESEESGSDDMSDEDLESFPDDGDIDGFDEGDGDDESEDEQPAPKKRENPYVAPVAATAEAKPGKYIPPSLRAASNSESESLTRLRRQAQGHLNKLSEANLVSILAEFEKLYREYPRQNVTSTLITLLFGLICERSMLQDTFIILHAGFIAAVYKVMGMDFGAEIVQKIVETFDAGGDDRGKFEGKEMINLISLLSQLYNFHVVGSTLVFDYIRLFLQDINEDNTELLLKVIRSTTTVLHPAKQVPD
jgi:nucleolar MIF4G domain-containing protein 1